MPAVPQAARPLRGRDAELGTVLAALRHAQSGRSALVVVRGEPGIGKSALLGASVDQASALGFTATAAAAHETDELSPLASLGPALRCGPVPLLNSQQFLDLAPLTVQPLWLAEHLAVLLQRRAGSTPLLIALDDAQWADPLTTFVLRILLGRLRSAPIAFLLGTRPAAGGPADQVVGGMERNRWVRWIDLAPLRDEAVLAVAVDHLGHAADPELAQRLLGTRGNPFLAVALLRGLIGPDDAGDHGDDLPTGLLDGVRRRTASASERCRALLRAAGVLGVQSRLDDLAQLLGEPATQLTGPLEEAIGLGLLTDDGVTITFRNELLRRAVYQDMPPSARAAMHRSVVAHLIASGRGHAAAAPHVLASAVPGDATAVRVLQRAAKELLRTMAVTAVTLIQRAFELVADDDPEREEVARDVVTILVTARHHDEAAVFVDRLLQGAVSPGTAAVTQLSLAPHLWSTGRLGELAGRTRDPRFTGAAPALRARLAAYAALATGSDAGELAPDPVARSLQLVARAEQAERADECGAARGYYEQARAAAEEGLGEDGPGEAGSLHASRLELRELLVRGRLDDINGALARLADLDAHGIDSDPWQAPRVAVVRAVLELGAGRLGAAQAAATAALQWSGDIGDTVDARLWHVLVLVAFHRGEPSEARSRIADAERRGVPVPVGRALLALDEDEPRAAAGLVRELAAGAVPWPEELLVEAACAAHRCGDSDTLHAADDVLGALAARNPGVASMAGAAALTHGLLIGKPDGAVDLLRQAPRPLLLARSEEEVGRAALDRGDPSSAESLQRARDGFAACGATAAVLRVQRLLQPVGARRPRGSAESRPRAATGWESLTTMERRVAGLIADGHTNRSAAAELHLSPSTINTHLRAVFTKLGVHSRVQLAKLVLSRADEPGTGPALHHEG
ncbi:ATP-binding protein [Pseudonocardia sp. CA-142604]|uniref:ATP-binding protein n=1 Tax=Pseudonocardia sp. CA-142604 TaxID=3240024 RepID=UPI003D8E2DBF